MPSTITITNTFATESGTQPASQLDTNFAQLVNANNSLNTFNTYFTDTGVANALAFSFPSGLSASLTKGLLFQVTAAATNTSSTVTLNPGGLGATNVVNIDGTSLGIGQIQNGSTYLFQFTGSNFVLVGVSKIVQDNLGNFYCRGIDFCTYKPSATSRSSAISLTADPNLTIAVSAAGYYRFKADLYPYAAVAGGTPGFAVTPAYTGTTGTSGMWSLVGYMNGVALSGRGGSIGAGQLFSVGLAAEIDIITLQGTVQLTSGGTFSINWAQSVSSASATTLNQGSSLTLEQLS